MPPNVKIFIYKSKQKWHVKKILLIISIPIFLFAGIAVLLAYPYTEYLWFKQLGFSSVFYKRIGSQLIIGILGGLIAFSTFVIHFLIIRKQSRSRKTTWTPLSPAGELVEIFAISSVAGIVFGYWGSRHWEEWLFCFNSSSFEQSEPVFNKNIAFYFFKLPLFIFIQKWSLYLVCIHVLFAVILYFYRNAISIKDASIEIKIGAQSHLLVMFSIVFLVLACGWRLEMFKMLFSNHGVVYGASYIDIHVYLIVYYMLFIACILCAIFLFYFAYIKLSNRRAISYSIYSLSTVGLFYVLGIFVCQPIIEKYVVRPNKFEKEKPYIGYLIQKTHHAYGLDKFVTKEYSGNDTMLSSNSEDSPSAFDNIRSWDYQRLRSAFKKLQTIRDFYDFPSITIDRYRIENDSYHQTMLSPRELDIDLLPPTSQTWINRHLQYTHGYGVCLSPAKSSTSDGLPDFWIKDIPPQSKYSHTQIMRPEIYFGQKTNKYVIVKTKAKEFDYPRGEENQYTNYQGHGGVNIGGLFRRFLFAIRFSDIHLIFNRYLTPESRILFNRSIQDRISTLSRFLMLDQDPYLVISDGRLFWIQDAYTFSDRYPYSQPHQSNNQNSFNYIRNSVKVIIDAYHGSVTYYIWDDQDPLIQTYRKIFPSLFKPINKMPRSLKMHMRYPKYLLKIQAIMFETIHMIKTQLLNNKDKSTLLKTLEELNTNKIKEREMLSASREPYYTMMLLPHAQREEFLLIMAPLALAEKDKVAWLTARCDGDQYGELILYRFLKQKLQLGPM